MRKVEELRRQTEQELSLARRIQQTFLPETLPQIPGYDLAVEWKTARQVGGDFYDVIQLDDQRYGLLIADVSDKGLPASLYMTVARTLYEPSRGTLAHQRKHCQGSINYYSSTRPNPFFCDPFLHDTRH